MNKKKVFVVIAVLLVALVSASSVIYASQEADDNVKSDLTAAQSGNETQPEDAEADEKVRYMFVQSAHSGSFVPVEGEMNYTLTLEGVSPQTIAFSGFCFSSENPPNAAIEILEGNESEDVLVVELFDPVYDAANHTLQYNVSVLEMPNHSHAIFNERHDESLPEHFGPAALFIDYCGRISVNYCWKWWPPGCYPCDSDDELDHKCAERFGDKCGHANY
jgi:hypothetical protein